MWQLYTFERVCKQFCVKLFENFLGRMFSHKKTGKSMMSVNTKPPPKPLVI